MSQRTTDVTNVDSAVSATANGWARLPWAECGVAGEERLHQAGISIRCLTRSDGSIPDSLDEDGLVAIAARAY